MKQEEEILQHQVEMYLQFKRLKYIHIPKKVQGYLFRKGFGVPAYIASLASKSFKGAPDLLIFGSAGRCLIIELKSKKGALTPEQKEWINNGMVVCRTFEEAKMYIDNFLM